MRLHCDTNFKTEVFARNIKAFISVLKNSFMSRKFTLDEYLLIA